MASSHKRWIIFVPVALLALWSTVAKADVQQGLNTSYYTIDEVPPFQSDGVYPLCGSELENNINRSYDGEPFENCTDDLFMVHMTGFITIPEHNTIEFWLASDDGGEITIGNNTWGSWTDQGCSAWESGSLQLQAGVLPLELWMYENGGGTCIMLAWKIDNNDWEIVPEWAFTTTSTPQTTTSTTTVPETTVPVTVTTTTTVPETSTSSTSTTTSTTSTSTTSTTTTTTTSSTLPAPVEIYVPEEPEITETGTTEPVEEEPIPEEMIPEETDTTVEEVTTTTEEVTTTSEAPEETSTTIELDLEPNLEPNLEPLADEEVEALIAEATTVEELQEALEELTPEQVEQVVDQILEQEEPPTQEQAVALATSPEVLSVVTPQQAVKIFESLDVAEISEEEKTAVTEAVQSAPVEVRQAFEDTIDIFSDDFGDYVPLGSAVPVDTRRTLIAVAAGTATVAASQRRR
jgi:uncharacterized protein YejL (UPF0352 family)